MNFDNHRGGSPFIAVLSLYVKCMAPLPPSIIPQGLTRFKIGGTESRSNITGSARGLAARLGRADTGSMPPGRILIYAGVILVVAGILVTLLGKAPFSLGRLPGDIRIQGRNTSFYFPLATCLVLSLIISLVMRMFHR
jgi:hypothetical protein